MKVLFALFFVLPCYIFASAEVECSFRAIDRSRIHKKETFAGSSNQAVSSNWSGYVTAASLEEEADNSVSYVAGSWMIPSLLSTPDTSYCAIWVGMDGYLNGTVEQMGTAHDWVDGVQQNFAWFEMYPNGPYELVGFPVNVGDQISVRIGYKGDGQFKFVLHNFTQDVITTVPVSYTTSSSALRSSAEWIVEAPYSSGILPLADFQLSTFNYCSAIINGVNGAINNGSWESDAILMAGGSDMKSVPSVLLKDGHCFQVRWSAED